MMSRGTFGRSMCTTSCRPVGVGLDPELDNDRSVYRRLSGDGAMRGSEAGVEGVGGVLLVRSLSSQIWTRTLLPV